MDNLNLTPEQQEELAERDGLLKLEMEAIVDDMAWLDACCYFIEDQYALINRTAATCK